VAIVNGQPITRADLKTHADYALQFYAWTYGSDVGSSDPSCTLRSKDVGCRRLEQQVLRRLIEEKVVEEYAAGHRIALSAEDQSAARREATDLLANDTTAANLLAEHKVNRSFIEVLLDREALIRRVENVIGRNQPRAGQALHLREFEVPRLTRQDDARTYQQAVDLATDGRPVPPGAMVRTSWIARFHLSAELLNALSTVSPGQFVGPFSHSGYYLDVQFLGRGVHRYGKPARLELQTAYFRQWLAVQVKRAHPQCFDRTGQEQPCPASQR
jgi:hypothetical protein